MVKKLSDEETRFLIKKYTHKGNSLKEAQDKVNKTISTMVISPLTMII